MLDRISFSDTQGIRPPKSTDYYLGSNSPRIQRKYLIA